MKQPLKIILLFLTLCSFELVNGQIYELKINKSKNSKLVKVLNNGVLIGKTNANYLLVKIYKVDNGSGSAKLEEGHERSFNLLVAISEYDEYPKQNVFEVGPFYNPEFVEWTEIKKYEREFTIKHGGVDNRVITKLRINIESLKLIKSQ